MDLKTACAVCGRAAKIGVTACVCGALISVTVLGGPGEDALHVPQEPYHPMPTIQMIVVVTTSSGPAAAGG